MKDSVLRPAVNVPDEMERDKLVRRIAREEKRLYAAFCDIWAWNHSHPNEKPITLKDDYDPDGLVAAQYAKIGIDVGELWRRAQGDRRFA